MRTLARISKPKQKTLKIDQYTPILPKKSLKEQSPPNQEIKQKLRNEENIEKQAHKNSSNILQMPQILRAGSQNKRVAHSLVDNSNLDGKSKFTRSKSLFFNKNKIIDQKTSSNDFYVTQNNIQENQIETIVDNILASFQKKYIIIIKSGQATIKRQKLFQILSSTFKYLTGISDSANNEETYEIIQLLSKVKRISSMKAYQRRQQKLSQSKETVDISFSPNDYFRECKRQEKQLISLISRKKDLENEISNHQQKKLQLSKLYSQVNQQLKNIKTEYGQLMNKSEELSAECKKMEEQNTHTKQEINRLTNELNQLNQKGQQIFLFVETQKKRPFLKKVSRQYKYKESIMFDFAYEMQCRPKMSSYTWEPQPFQEMGKHIKADLKHVITSIQDWIRPSEDIKQQMIDFINKSFRKLSAKDRQLEKVYKEKTDAINRYIQIVKLWYQDHAMKQQYLGTMRKEYAFDSEQVFLYIGKFQSSELSNEQRQWLKEMRKYYEWVDLAFKYGNSFY